MDIVTRLRRFMDANGIAVTQFADTCGIPRPSLSQLLSGRNKKVSDEVVAKIHRGYPSLSMMWLLFGEGEMGSAGNGGGGAAPVAYGIGGDAADGALGDDVLRVSDYEDQVPYMALPPRGDVPAGGSIGQSGAARTGRIDFGDGFSMDGVDGPAGAALPRPSGREADGGGGGGIGQQPAAHASGGGQGAPVQGGRRVVSIVVYYDDLSYESFVPSSSRAPFPQGK